MGDPLGNEMIEAADQLYEKMIAYDPTIDGVGSAALLFLEWRPMKGSSCVRRALFHAPYFGCKLAAI